MSIMYHDGNRKLQDRFDSRRIADRLEEKLTRVTFNDDDKALIESVAFFFIATADARGWPDCSFKGRPSGFVRITGPSELAFPDYDGNGMFKSLGNLVVNPNIGAVVHLHERQAEADESQWERTGERHRSIAWQDYWRPTHRAGRGPCHFSDAHLYSAIQVVSPSIYTPQPKCEAPEPAWKSFDALKDAVHPRQPTWKG